MKNLSITNTVVLLVSVAILIMLLLINVAFFKSMRKADSIQQAAIVEIQSGISTMKSELMAVNESIGVLKENAEHASVERRQLAEALEGKEDKSDTPNVRMILPLATKEEIERRRQETQERAEAEQRLRDSVDTLVQRMGSLEENIQADRTRVEEISRDLRSKIKVTIDYAEDNRQMIEETSASADRAIAGIDRLDWENREMNYNYDAVLAIRKQKAEERNRIPDTPAEEVEEETPEAKSIIEGTVSEPVSEEKLGMTERPAPTQKKRFFLIRFFQWIGNLF